MKRAIVGVLLVACHAGTGTGTGKGTDCKLATDDAVNAQLKSMGRPPQPKEYACIEHALDDRVALIGDFAYDRGCDYGEVFVGCKLDKNGDDKQILADLGWPTMTNEQRVDLVTEYLSTFQDVRGMSESGGAPFGADGHPAFEVPKTETTRPDGAIVYTAWFESSDGGGMVMATTRTFSQTAYTITSDGTLSAKVLAQWSIPYK